MNDSWTRADQIASVVSAIAAVIGLIGAIAGLNWLAIIAFMVLCIVAGFLAVLLYRNRKEMKGKKRFLAEQGFTPFPLGKQKLTLQPFSVPGAPNGFINLGGVPFQIETQDHGALMAMIAPTSDNEARVLDHSTPCPQTASIFFLISADYGLKSWQGAKPREGWDEKVIGRITLTFHGGEKQEQELRLGHHLRDTYPGNQPWAVDQLRSDQTKEVWLSQDGQFALDMLQINVENGPKRLEGIRILAKLEVPEVPRVSLLQGASAAGEPKLPGIKILGVTCWSTDG